MEVDMTTLRDLLSKHGVECLDLLLIDVEGAELRVLQGFPWEIVSVARIFCELHPYAWRDFGYCSRQVKAFLTEHGLACTDIFFQEYDFPDGLMARTTLAQRYTRPLSEAAGRRRQMRFVFVDRRATGHLGPDESCCDGTVARGDRDVLPLG
jgi:hypothetical protein